MIDMPFCKICGEYHHEDNMSIEDVCIFCDVNIIHENHSKDDFFKES
jgi:hypothetical protein